MTMQEEILTERRPPGFERGSVRLNLWCAIWAIAAVLGAAMAVLAARPGVLLFGLSLTAYALQAALAEYLGVKVGREAVSTPRRLISAAPLITFWREEIPLNEIIEVAALPNAFGVERVIARRAFNLRTPVFFPTREAKLSFFDAIKRFNPNVSIYRSQ